MHQHSHAHETTSTSVSRKLVIASIATLILVGGELVAGRIAGSLSLVGDALHNFTDVLALVIALAAVRISKRPATHAKSFGYQRAGILAAFINAGSLLAFTVFIVVEAIKALYVDTGIVPAGKGSPREMRSRLSRAFSARRRPISFSSTARSSGTA